MESHLIRIDEIMDKRFDFPENIIRVTAGPGGEALLVFGSERTALVCVQF